MWPTPSPQLVYLDCTAFKLVMEALPMGVLALSSCSRLKLDATNFINLILASLQVDRDFQDFWGIAQTTARNFNCSMYVLSSATDYHLLLLLLLCSCCCPYCRGPTVYTTAESVMKLPQINYWARVPYLLKILNVLISSLCLMCTTSCLCRPKVNSTWKFLGLWDGTTQNAHKQYTKTSNICKFMSGRHQLAVKSTIYEQTTVKFPATATQLKLLAPG